MRSVSVLFLEVRSSKKAVLLFCGCISCKKIVPSLTSLFVQCLLLLLFLFFICCWPLKKENRIKRQLGTRIVALRPSTA